MKICATILAATMLISLTACATAPDTALAKSRLQADAENALALAQREDPMLSNILKDAYGYAVFPSVGKGGIGVGGAYGRGVLYERGNLVGYCDVSQATIGLQLGGQAFTQIICFETKDAVDRFKSGSFAFDATASAVALKSGATANAKYANGVLVFTMDEAGLMYQATVGGQRFSYQPK